MSHYETLKVDENANSDDIKKAFRRLASRHHPDKGGDTKEFQKIQEAYDTLSDPEKRQRYDMERRGGASGVRFHWNGGDMDLNELNDLFSRFSFRNQGHPQAGGRKNRDLRININVSLRETLESHGKTLMIRTTNGKDETLNINIPRGINDGAVIKYPGLGDNLFATLPRGDLYVNFHIDPDPRFQIIDADILTKIQINCFDAIVGGESEIEGIDGKKFVINIPAGTQHGAKLRIKNQGLYTLQSTERGNLLVEILISIPRGLDDKMLDMIKQIQSSL